MSTLTMVRTACCEACKQGRPRCSICPNRPENRAAVLKYKSESGSSLGCNLEQFQGCHLKHPSAIVAGLSDC
jgi:hypothetical protein